MISSNQCLDTVHRYDEFGRLKKKFRETGGSDRDAREKAALARLRGESDGGGQVGLTGNTHTHALSGFNACCAVKTSTKWT